MFDMAAKRKLAAMSPTPEASVDPADELMFLCLGGGNEVGRSCHIVQYKGKTIMVGRSHPVSNVAYLSELYSSMLVCTRPTTVLLLFPSMMNST